MFDREVYSFPRESQAFPLQWDETLRLFEGAELAGVLDAPFKIVGSVPRKEVPGKEVPGKEVPGKEVPGIDGLAATAFSPAVKVEDLNPVRIRVVAEQLWLLGYLAEKPRKNFSAMNQARDKFQGAVATFQEEAGLIVDGWVGDETWRALGALVGFESLTDIDRWTQGDGSYQRAFRRAIQLRLYSYGLAKQQPGPGFVSVPPANEERACQALWAIGLIPDLAQPLLPIDWVPLMFDHDGLVKAAAQFDETFESARTAGEEHRKVRLTLRRLLVNLAKIELWLLGSEARIDGADDYPVAGLGTARVTRQRGSRRVTVDATDRTLRAFLVEYWQELLDLPVRAARSAASEITPALFKSLTDPSTYARSATVAFDEPDYSSEVSRYFEQQSSTTATIANAFTEAKRMGMKLFDGLQRLWRWIKQGVRRIVQFAKNMFRAFFRFAIKGYVMVRTAFTALTRALAQYANNRIDVPEQAFVDVFIAPDFDTQVILDPLANDASVVSAASAVARFGAMFQLSMRIVALIVDVLKSAFTGLLGWARLLMVLVKHYRELVPAYRELVAVL